MTLHYTKINLANAYIHLKWLNLVNIQCIHHKGYKNGLQPYAKKAKKITQGFYAIKKFSILNVFVYSIY